MLTGAGGGTAQAAKAGLLGEQAETKWNEDRWWNKLGFAEGGEVSEAEGWAAESAKYAKANKDVANISASDLLDFVPVVGDIKGAYEVVQEMQKEDPNWALIGALAGATIIGVVPGIGDAAAAAIKQGAKAGLKGVKGGIDLAKRIEVDPNAVGSLGGNIRLKPVGDVKIGDPVPDDIGKREFTPTTPSQSLVQTQSNIPPRASGHTETRETSGLLAGPDVWRDRLYGEPTPNPNVPPPSQFSKPIVEKKTGSQYRDPNIDRFMAPADATRSGIAPRTSEPTGLLGRPPVRKQDTTFTKAPTNKPDEMLASVEPMITDIMKKNKSIIKDYDDSLQAARTAVLEAAETFDPKKGKFSTHVYDRIVRAVRDPNQISDPAKRKAASKAEDRTVGLLQKKGDDGLTYEETISGAAPDADMYYKRTFGKDADFARALAEQGEIKLSKPIREGDKIVRPKRLTDKQLRAEFGLSPREFAFKKNKIKEILSKQ